ncbi:MAG: hypothetical protein HYZ29_07765 [Myxococcales bacterium]|nr:hypothetical protein [Myxococcales bacterium]
MKAIVLISVAATACVAPTPAAEPAPRKPAADGAEPASAEWLYATEGVKGGRVAECRQLVEVLSAEAGCKGALCSHAASLSKDWLRLCKARTPALAPSVEAQADLLSKRAAQVPAPCEAEAQRLLGKSCEGERDCPKAAQGWATRCAEWSTPLVVRMLEVMVERKVGERAQIDGRGCGELLGDVAKAGACAQQFACQDGFPTIEVYEQRCVSPSRPLSSTAAVLALAVRAGATPRVEPLVIAAADKLDPALVPLALEDGKGAVLMTCGKRATSIDAYLGLRAACADEALVLARRFDGPSGPVMRVGRIDHRSDADFLALFPSLRVEGEPKARYRAALPGFTDALEQAQLGADSEALAQRLRLLIATIDKHADAVRNSSAFEKALRDRDGALLPLFAALGAAKRKAVHADQSSDRFVPALHRSLSHPLADVDADGRVRLGAVTAAGSVELADLLPKAIAAYRDELSGRVKLLDKKKLTVAAADRLAVAAHGAASRCGQAMKAFEAAEATLIGCAFGVQACDDAKLESETQAAVGARRQAELAWPKVALALASLPPDQRAGATKAAELAGCREPWW